MVKVANTGVVTLVPALPHSKSKVGFLFARKVRESLEVTKQYSDYRIYLTDPVRIS